MFKIQGLEFKDYLEDIQLKLVRTYKGEIARTLAGKIVSFPANFITVGFTVSLLAQKDKINLVQQLLLSGDIVEITAEYNGSQFKGNFSCTDINTVEIRDKGARHMRLTASLVSDGSEIKKPNGAYFTVKTASATLKSNCTFGKVYNLGATAYSLNGAKLPGNNVLILGDTTVVKIT